MGTPNIRREPSAEGLSAKPDPSFTWKSQIDWTPIFGFDVFISYKRKECSVYAGSLERQLRDRDLRCFLDDHDIPPGVPLSATIRAALRRSRILVVIISAGSLQSKYVHEEVREFMELHRQ